MPSSVQARLDAIQGKRSAARFASPDKSERRGEGGRKDIATDEQRAAGRIFARALNRAGLDPKDAAERLGYSATSDISRLTSGVGVSAVIARFLADPRLVEGLVEALAELPGDRVTVRTQIQIARAEAV